MLLQARLVVASPRRFGTLIDDVAPVLEHEAASDLVIGLQEDGTHQGLDDVAEDRLLAPAARHRLTLAQQQCGTDLQRPSDPRQSLLVDDGGAHLRHLAFGHVGPRVVEVSRHRKLQNGVAEKLEPLVGRRRLLLAGEGSVHERFSKEPPVRERVPEKLLDARHSLGVEVLLKHGWRR